MYARNNIFQDLKIIFLVFIYIISFVLIYLNLLLPCEVNGYSIYYRPGTMLLYDNILYSSLLIIIIFILCFIILEGYSYINKGKYIIYIVFILFLIPVLFFFDISDRDFSLRAKYILGIYSFSLILLFLLKQILFFLKQKSMFINGAFYALMLLLPHIFLMFISFDAYLLCSFDWNTDKILKWMFKKVEGNRF